MLNFHRRQFLGVAAAGAAFGILRPIEILPSALAQAAANPLNPKELRFHKFKVGDIEVTTVFDGGVFRDINAGLVRNASVDDIRAALKGAGFPDDRMPNTYTVTFVKVGGRTVMFDSGNGAGRSPGIGLLAENAKAAGVDPATVYAIVVTHFHPDHIWGLYGAGDAPLYQNAEIVVPEPEYKFWSDPSVIDKLPEARRGIAKRVQASMPTWKTIRQAAAGTEVAPGIKSVATYGHTPGHTSYLVSSGSAMLMVLGDVTSIPPLNLRNPGWHAVVDQDAKMAEETRRSVFEKAIADKTIMTGYHWGMPGAGTLQKDGNGYALVPVV